MTLNLDFGSGAGASYYEDGRRYTPIEVIEDWGLNFSLGNVVKYLSRAGRKPGVEALDDLRKALWYLQREIAAQEAGTKTMPDTTVQGSEPDFPVSWLRWGTFVDGVWTPDVD